MAFAQIRITSDFFSSHDGLRGATAVWIMLFHTIIYSRFPLDFQGSSIMPLFFLLSGFSLTMVYRSRSTQSNVVDVEADSVSAPWLPVVGNNEVVTSASPGKREDADSFSKWNFYLNRVARMLPTYYLGLLFALPLRLSGFGSTTQTNVVSTVLSAIVSFLPLCTTFIFLLGDCIDGPGWTICTLAIMWLMFPWSFRAMAKLTDEQLVNRISLYYWLQLATTFGLFFALIAQLGFWPAFAAATMQPFTRYRLFLMGAYAGELSFRHLNSPTLPWPKSVLHFFPIPVCGRISAVERDGGANEQQQQRGHVALPDGPASDTNHWSGVATRQAFVLLILTLLISLVDGLARHLAGSDGILGAVWFQAIVPFAQLDLLVALTRDGGQSLVSKALRTPTALWLGKLSMPIYLLHYPVIFYLCWAVYGKPSLVWPTEWNCDQYPHQPGDDFTKFHECVDPILNWMNARSIGLWGIVAVPAITIPLAAAVHYGFEEPLRRALRSRGA